MKEIAVSGDEQIILNVKESMEFVFQKRARGNIYLILDSLQQCNLGFYFKEDFAKANIHILFLSSRDFIGSAKIICIGRGNNIKIDIKGIVRNQARAFFEGGGFIDSNAKGTDLYISEQGIIFDNAKLEFFPNLQIENNDVKAGHAASVRKYKDEDLFYLMSRGLPEKESRILLLEGFLQDFENMINIREVLRHA
jgi:hypothetical protein